jgi:hypothetical protein
MRAARLCFLFLIQKIVYLFVGESIIALDGQSGLSEANRSFVVVGWCSISL